MKTENYIKELTQKTKNISLSLAMLLSFLTLHSSLLAKDDLPVIAVPKVSDKLVIDGKFEDSWGKAALIDGLRPARSGTYQDKINNVPSKIMLLYDDDFLYVAFECHDEDIFVSGNMKRDYDLYKEDVVEVFIDGFGDSRQWIEIQISPLGEILDLMFVLATEERHGDNMVINSETHRHLFSFREWNCESLQVAVGKIFDNEKNIGWRVEMAIPAKDILKRYGKTKFVSGMTIRANFLRYDYQPKDKGDTRELIHMNWAPVQHGCPHISPAAMGYIKLK